MFLNVNVVSSCQDGHATNLSDDAGAPITINTDQIAFIRSHTAGAAATEIGISGTIMFVRETRDAILAAAQIHPIDVA